MRAAVRLLWLYCTVFSPWTRLGFTVFSLLILLGVTRLSADFLAAIGSQAIGALGLMTATILLAVATPSCIVGGAALRFLAAPSSHRLLPRLRATVLASVGLLAAAAVGASWALLLAAEWFRSGGGDGPDSALAVSRLLLVFAVITAEVYLAFRFTRATLRGGIELVIVAAIVVWIAEFIELAGAPPWAPWILLAALTALWLGFGVWYLRAPGIAPARTGGPGAGAGSALPDRIGAALAGEILLTGWRIPPFGPSVLAAAVAGALLGRLAVLLDSFQSASRPSSVSIEIILAGMFSFTGMTQLNWVASRTRRLWLLGCGSRRDLFHRIELGALKYGFLMLVLVVSTTASRQLGGPTGLEGLPAAVLAILGLFLLTAYLTLAAARPLGFARLSAAVLALFYTAGVFSAALGGVRILYVMALVAVELAVALALRSVAKQRWESVDWLEYKVGWPPRLLTRG